MKKEYGGYLTIEQGMEEYYDERKYRGILRFNAARYAIIYAVKHGKYNRIWIPYYLCKSVYDVLKRYGVNCVFYSINSQLEPEINNIEDRDSILIVNYYGIKDQQFYRRMERKYRNIIFDNTQAFFAEPVLKEGVYNVYSPRKFVGVADGAYLISLDKITDGIDFSIEIDYSYGRVRHIYEALENGINECYNDALSAERELAESPIKYMSKLTIAMLKNVNYSFIKKRRVENYKILERNYKTINEISDLTYLSGQVPMVYPLLVSNGDKLRKILVSMGIYVSQWWKWILEDDCNSKINQVERYLAMNLIPIPIDQRYREKDIKKMIEIINSVI